MLAASTAADPAPTAAAAETVSSAASSAKAALSIFPCARLASARRASSCLTREKSTVAADPSTSGLGAAEPMTAATMHDFAAVTGSSTMATRSSSGLQFRQ